jgi:HPt (histidine-containing phosphotransfer) domain-containing protein
MTDVSIATLTGYGHSLAGGPEFARGRESARAMRITIALVAAAIAVFMAFTVLSVHMTARGRTQISAIEELYFPVLQLVDANSIRIDKMEEEYFQAVEFGDKDSLGKASAIGLQADRDFTNIAQIYTSRAAEIATLSRDLEAYHAAADEVASAFLAHKGTNGVARTQIMNWRLATLRADLKAFRKASYENFVATLNATEGNARTGSILGFALGAMNLGFMGVLVFFIRNNMRVATRVAEQNANLEARVEERTAELSKKNADINAMLQNMKLGVSTVIAGNRIHGAYSAYLRTIFEEEDLANEDLVSKLFAHSDLGVDLKDQIQAALMSILGEDAMMFEFNGHLLPREMTLVARSGARKLLQLDWSPIPNEQGCTEKVLLISQDVTHLRALEAQSAQQQEELETISKILRTSAAKFNDFVESTRRFLAENRRLIARSACRDAEIVAVLFRNMHTIKGNARTFDFTQITDAAHVAERRYELLRADPAGAWKPHALLADLAAIDGALSRHVAINEAKLGRRGRASDLMTERGVFVDGAELDAVRDLALTVPAAALGAEGGRLVRAIGRLGLVPMERLFSGVADALAALAGDLGKPIPRVIVAPTDASLRPQFAEALKRCLLHIARNAMDHGIEAPAERLRAGKKAEGHISFSCELNHGRLELLIADDGRGLALHDLFAKAVATGQFRPDAEPSPEAVAEVAFQPGVSTAAQVTEISGRGVGLNAVRSFLEEQGASVRAELLEVPARRNFTPFRLRITVPADACVR